MKKTLSVLLTLVMLLTFVPVTAFAASAVAMTVTPSASSVDVGDSVTVTVAISGNAEKAVGMQASLTYDPTVLQYESFTPKNANFKTSDFNLYSAGNFVMLYEDPTVTGVDITGDIVEVTLTALAPSDGSSVALNIIEFYDNNDEDFSLDMTGASTSIAVTAADVAAPTLTDTGASNLSVSGATISFTSDEAGTYYYVALPASDPTPIASAVKGGVSGSALVGANSVDITGLAASTAYKVCLVVSDGADNTSEVAVIEFTTASASAPVTNVQVELTAQAASAFLFAPQNVTVSSNLAESYGYTDSVSGVSALDALVRAHELTFGTGFTPATAEDYLIVNDTGGITKEFGVQTMSVGFAVNGISPNDGVYVPAYGGNTGYTITQAPIQTNDLVEFYFLEDSSWMDQYVWFSQDGAITDSLSATAGIPADITLEGYYIGFYGCNYSTLAEAAADKGAAIEDAQLALVDAATGALTDISGAVTDENGNVSVTFPLEGTFKLTAYMPQVAIDEYYASPIILPLATVTVAAASTGAATPTFDTDLSTDEVSYIKDQTATPLTVAAIVTDGGTVTYQWYGSADNSTFSPIDGEADASYTPSTSTVGTMYYYVVATNTLDGSTATATSSVACVTVTGTTATAPTFDTDLSTAVVNYFTGDTANALTVAASASEGGTVTLQWYVNAAFSTTGGTALEGETGTSYTPPTEAAIGFRYYYVVATNTLNGCTATTASKVAQISVNDQFVFRAVDAQGNPVSNAAISVSYKSSGYYIWTQVSPVAGTTDTYRLNNGTLYNYRISADGYRTYSTNVTPQGSKQQRSITVTLSDQPHYHGENPLAYLQNDIVNNISDSNYIVMSQGETQEIYPHRAWQIVSDVVSNPLIEPDYHYTVISGDSVTVDGGGIITAVSSGVSIIAVSYDAIDAFVGSGLGGTFSAIDPDRTAIIVVNVDGSSSNTVSSGIDLSDAFTGYYLNGTSGFEYTFTPSTTSGGTLSVELMNPIVGADAITGFTAGTVTANGDGSYTALLTDGRNIIKVSDGGSVQYYVVAAKPITYTTNITNDADNNGTISAGDTVTIRFNGVYIPVPKLAGLYNPSAGAMNYYTNPAGTQIKGVSGGQYSYATTNLLTVTIPENATAPYKLTAGLTHQSWFGSGLGITHGWLRSMSVPPNLDAPVNTLDFYNMPDITLISASQTPSFETDLSTDEVKYVVGMTASELAVSASAGAEATLSYQWYSGTAADAVSSVINGAISESYTPDTTTVGTTYYKVVVTNTLNGKTADAASAIATVTVVSAPTLTAEVVTADDQQVPVAGYQYNTGDAATPLKAAVTSDVPDGTWSYRWRFRTASGWGSASGTNKQEQYTPPTTGEIDRNLYCYVTYSLNGTNYTMETSNTVFVSVIANSAAVPTISAQPNGGEYLVGSSDIRTLSVTASRTDRGTLSYQWYISSDNIAFNPVDGATANSYAPPASSEATTVYYYCTVTNTVSSVTGDVYTASANSDVVTLTFKSITDFGGTWAGTGTEADPFLIGGIDDLSLLQSLVNTQGLSFKGMYFKLTTSLTLPSDWVPLGSLKPGQTSTGNGTNIWPFSGTLDGSNYTVTVPEDGLPLLGYVRRATVKNLNIYGEKIAGYGLVNNYTVDYGPQGKYDNTVDNRTITIDNVTLKSDSSTLKAGFIGGYASGVNEVNINNSTIEAGVVIGYTKDQSRIGSFAGDFNGTVNNSVSHATVYGENYVGGLVSSKGQSMGVCAVRNSLFDGTVTATGNYAGGIMGSGYTSGSAPNTPCVSIQNCYVSGSITAADYLGGIFGGELACKQCWANGIGYIQNNYFSGTLTATATEPRYVGGIIGFMKSLDRYNIIENNYYLSTSAQVGIGQIEAIDYTTEKYGRSEPFVVDDVCVSSDNANFASGKIAALLNSGNNSDGIWTQSGAYPVFGSASTATHKITLTVTGNGTASLTGLTTADDTAYQNAGSPVTVTTTAESGNSLSSITVSDGSTTQDITNDGEFIMPQQDVTVEVIFAVSASPADGVTVTPTVAGDTASGTVDLTGASVETGAAFTVTATTGNDDVTRLDLTFTNETLAALANAGNLVIHTDFGDITLDADAIANLIANAGGGDVTLTVEAKAASELPEAQQGAAANADILLEISLTSGGSPIAFNNGTNGTMTIEVPFTPSSPDIDVTVYYIDETGTRTAMTSSCADGKVTFATTHLSLYAIEEEKSAYTVNLTTANTDRNVGETITVGLNVSGAADYASLQTTVSYDKTKVSYTDNTLTGFTVTNNAAAGTLTISRFGSTTSTGLQGYLTFTVNPDISTGSSEAAFSVASAVVGVRGDPSDAAAAGTGTDISVDVHNLTVTFEAGDHVTMATATAYVKYGVAGLYTTNAYETTFTYPNPSADTGCTLDAPMWTDGTDRTSFGIISETVFTANAVYTATATVDVYDIVYELDGGTNDTSNPATYSYGDSFTLAYPAKENCTFVGWYADDSFTTPVTGISATDTGDKTFYARWQGEVTITLPSQVTVVSGVTDGKANYGTDVVFTVTADPGYTLESVSYTVGSGSAVTLTASAFLYMIPGTALTDDVTVTVTQHVTGSVTFITFEDYKGAPMGFKVLLLEATVPEGYKYQYDGTDLFKSDKYAKYACFVPADVDAETALYTIACVAGTAPVINYDGNVNQSPDGAVTSADAQLIYDLYTGLIKYVSDSDFSKVSEKMRLAADINGDGTVDTADAQIVVNSIHNIV